MYSFAIYSLQFVKICYQVEFNFQFLFQLVESLKIALKGWNPTSVKEESCLEVRSSDESIKVSGVEKSELRTSVKVFITSDKKEALQEAIDKCKPSKPIIYF